MYDVGYCMVRFLTGDGIVVFPWVEQMKNGDLVSQGLLEEV